jgi:hypothetical protein
MSALLYLVAPASALLSGLNICDAVKVVLKKKAGIERVPVSPEERQRRDCSTMERARDWFSRTLLPARH